jgi:ribosomal protein S18 acetylase RimI-like enzyme
MDITVRAARPADADAIALGNIAMALETEHKHLDREITGAGVRAVFADGGRGRYFVAERAGRMVGQLMITYEWSDWRNGVFWWIQSVYVDPTARRSGVFRALYEHVERLARASAEVCGIRLYVERENRRAQETYRQCGMHDAGYLVMEVDYSGAVQPAGGDPHA